MPKVEPWVRELMPGDHVIYLAQNKYSYAIYKSPKGMSFRAMCFDDENVTGQILDIPLSAVMYPISRAQFHVASDSNWPPTAERVQALLNWKDTGAQA